MDKQTRVGVGVLVIRDGKFLLQERQGAHGAGTWAPPGGHLEFGESFEETARREVLEETGMIIKNVRFGGITNDYFEKEDKHYVTIWMLSEWEENEPQILEPQKCTMQEWVTFDTLPDQLFTSLEHFLASEFMENAKAQLQSLALSTGVKSATIDRDTPS